MASNSQARRARRARQAAGLTMPKRAPDGFSLGNVRQVMREENRVQRSQGLTSFEHSERDRVRNEAAASRTRADEGKRKQLDEWRDVIR